MLGTLGMFSYRVNAFGPRDRAVVERLVTQIAPAIENAQLYHHAKAEMAVVDEVARIITSTLDIDEVFERFAEEVQKLVGYERMDVCAFNQESGACTITQAVGQHIPGFAIGNTMPMSDSGIDALAREVVSGHRPFLVAEDFASESLGTASQAILDAGLHSGILLPMISNGQVFGVLSLLSQHTSAYGPREQAIIERLAMQIAPAFENAGIYEQVRSEMELVDEVARVITSTLELDEAYGKFAKEAKRLVEFDQLGIILIDRDAGVMYPHIIDGGVWNKFRVGRSPWKILRPSTFLRRVKPWLETTYERAFNSELISSIWSGVWSPALQFPWCPRVRFLVIWHYVAVN
ncbi:MAG: GAF domain-containing protein [Dehalococcoidia bacterium]